MTTHVAIEHGGDRRTFACKRATSPDAVPGLRAEAARLAALDHPGVVRFVELREEDDGPRLVTEYVGPRTLATIGRVTAERAALLLADAASTVADLHAGGIVHGDICPEHVLVAGDTTVLCSPAEEVDGLTPADDVHGLGRCLDALLEPDLDEEPIPDHRPWRRSPWVGYRHRALLTLADQATADDPGRRPSARALADAVGNIAGGTEDRRTALTVAQEVVDLVVIRLRRPRRRVLALGALGVVIAGVGAIGATSRPGRPPTTVAAARPACEAGIDLDGDGCPEAVELGHGWVEVDGRRYRVGRPGNDLAVGDWDGDGTDTFALLQRGSGRLWQFRSWDPDGAVTAEPAGDYPGAVELTSEPAGGHDRLVLRRRDGSATEVPA